MPVVVFGIFPPIDPEKDVFKDIARWRNRDAHLIFMIDVLDMSRLENLQQPPELGSRYFQMLIKREVDSLLNYNYRYQILSLLK